MIFSNCLYFYLPDLTTIISHLNGWNSLLIVLFPMLTSIFNPVVQMFLLKHVRSQHLPVVSNNQGMPLREKEIFVKMVCSTFWYLVLCCLLDTMPFSFPLSFLNFSHTDLLPFLKFTKHTSTSWPSLTFSSFFLKHFFPSRQYSLLSLLLMVCWLDKLSFFNHK